MRFPSSLLASRTERHAFYDSHRDEYFFDRSREAFEGVLFFYQSNGLFETPFFVPSDVFYDELKFFKLAIHLNTDCKCEEELLAIALKDQLDDLSKRYNASECPQAQMNEETRKSYQKEKRQIKARFKGLRNFINDIEEETYDDEEDIEKKLIPANKYQKWIWLLMEKPNSSIFGKMIAFLCLMAVITSVAIMCLETMVESKTNSTTTSHSKFSSNVRHSGGRHQSNTEDYEIMERKVEYSIIEFVCNLVFTIEIGLRLIASPNKKKFLKGFYCIVFCFKLMEKEENRFFIQFFIQIDSWIDDRIEIR